MWIRSRKKGSGGGGTGELVPQVPKMTSNTTPSGVASASGSYSGQPAYKAFNMASDDPWADSGTSNCWLQYEFPTYTKIDTIKYDFYTVPDRVTSFSVYGDGNLITTVNGPFTTGLHETKLPSANQGYYLAYKFAFNATNRVHVDTLQLYAYEQSGGSIPDGKTVTPINDIQTWLKCGGITDKSYTTISEVLADEQTTILLIADTNAVDYLVRSTSWVSNVVANKYAMSCIGLSLYCADTLLTNSTWRTAICNSSYYESVLNVKIPVMTSNTTPSGVAGQSGSSPSYDAWKAMQGHDNGEYDRWVVQGQNGYIQYKFTSAVKAFKVQFKQRAKARKSLDGTHACSLMVQGSNDGTNFTTIYTISLSTSTVDDVEKYIISPSIGYQYYRMQFSGYNVTYSPNVYCGLTLLQMYCIRT